MRERLLARLKKESMFDIACFLDIWMKQRPDRQRRPDISETYEWIVRAYINLSDKTIEDLDAQLKKVSGKNIRRADQIRIVNLAEIIAGTLEQEGLKAK